MTVTRVLDGLGSWSLQLREGTPQRVIDDLTFYGHVAITPGRVDVEAVGDGLLTAARYVGVIRAIGKDEPRDIGGQGTLVWLGDEDDKGAALVIPVTRTNATLATWVTALLPASVHVGTINAQPDPLARHTNTYQLMTPRKALSLVCAAFGVEYRVNGDSTIDVGTQAQLYNPAPRTDGQPTPIITRRPGADVDLRGVTGDMDVDTAVYDYSTGIVLLGRTESGTGEIVTGTIDAPSVPYVDRWGNPVVFKRMISESGETEGSIDQRKQLHLNRFARVTRTFALDVDDYEADGPINVGDYAFVYDPELGIRDLAREVSYRGETIWPDTIRISEHTWPVTAGHTVAYRNGAGVWTDLTPFVTWETGGGQITVGDLPRSLTRPSESVIDRRVDLAQATAPDASIPKAPTGLVLTTAAYIEPNGQTRAVIGAEWNPVTQNTDNTAIVDLAYYTVAARWTGRALPATSTTTTDVDVELTNLTPGLPYEVSVRAVDRAGNQSAPLLGTIVASEDNIAPQAPADPVLSSFLGQLVIDYLGVTAGGTPWADDTKQINVHVGAPGFAIGPTNRVDALPPFGPSKSAPISWPVGSPVAVRLQAEDHTGNLSAPSAQVVGATERVTGAQIEYLEVGKLVSGTMTAIVVVGNRIVASPGGLLTGQRTEMWSGGLRGFNDDEDETFDFNGVDNLLVGSLKTGFPGERRIEIGTGVDIFGSGSTGGAFDIIAPDGTTSSVIGFTAGGFEGIWMGVPISPGSTAYASWNGFQAQENQSVFAVSKTVDLIFGSGGTAGVGAFVVEQTTNHAISVTSARRARYQIDATNHVWWSPSGTNRRMQLAPHFNSPNDSPTWILVNEENFGAGIKFAATSGGGSPALQVVTPDGGSFANIQANSFLPPSDEAMKDDITPVSGLLAELLAADEPVITYRLKAERRGRTTRRPATKVARDDAMDGAVDVPDVMAGDLGRTHFGLSANRVPARMQVQSPDGLLAYDLASGVALGFGAIRELAATVLPELERLAGIVANLEERP